MAEFNENTPEASCPDALSSAGSADALDLSTTPAYMAAAYSDGRPVPSRAQIRANRHLASLLAQSYPRVARALLMCAEDGLICNRTKLCAICCQARRRRLIHNHKVDLVAMSNVRLLTLTMYPISVLRPANVQTLSRAVSMLRRRARFKRAVAGGISSVEIARNDGWLVHAHVVLDLREHLPEYWIKDAWRSLGGAQRVELRQKTYGSPVRMAAYIVKRAKLPRDPELARQFVHATWGARMVQAFGSLHALHSSKRTKGKS